MIKQKSGDKRVTESLSRQNSIEKKVSSLRIQKKKKRRKPSISKEYKKLAIKLINIPPGNLKIVIIPIFSWAMVIHIRVNRRDGYFPSPLTTSTTSGTFRTSRPSTAQFIATCPLHGGETCRRSRLRRK